MPERFMSVDELREEFGLDPDCVPVSGVRMIDHQPIPLYREEDVIKRESD